MSEKVLLSFVIPVYNVEKYLNECLDSVFDSSVSEDEYEVIAIDDGSTDRSPEILKTYTHHKNFRIITQENAGQGAARNVGIKAATGKYISFVDSDDYLLPGAVPTLLGWARESDCDIIEFNFETSNETSRSFGQLRPDIKRWPLAGQGKTLYSEWYRQGVFLPSVWDRIYKQNFLCTHLLYFMQMIYEDAEWQLRCFFYAESVVYYPLTLYHYRRRDGSTMLTSSGSKECWNYIKLITAQNEFRRAIKASAEETEFYKDLCDTIAGRFAWLINTMYETTPKKERTMMLSEMKKLKEVIYLVAVREKIKRGKRIYKLVCWLPSGITIKMFKLFGLVV